jgi:hypothetical protein
MNSELVSKSSLISQFFGFRTNEAFEENWILLIEIFKSIEHFSIRLPRLKISLTYEFSSNNFY